jgi:adenylylsulfate kinase
MRQKDIFPVYDKLQNREEKECFLNQHSVLLWLTGLSGAGKTTIASGLCKKLFENGFFSQIFDGDNIRDKLNYNLSFSEADRKLNIIRIAVLIVSLALLLKCDNRLKIS